MNQDIESILCQYTVEELVKILDEECQALNIPCKRNVGETTFEELVPPSFYEKVQAFSKQYVIQAVDNGYNKVRPYSALLNQKHESFTAWSFEEKSLVNGMSFALQSAA